MTESTEFLLEQHNLAMLRALVELMHSQVMRVVMGQQEKTQSSSRRLVLSSDDDILGPGRTHDNMAGGSGTINDPMDLTKV